MISYTWFFMQQCWTLVFCSGFIIFYDMSRWTNGENTYSTIYKATGSLVTSCSQKSCWQEWPPGAIAPLMVSRMEWWNDGIVPVKSWSDWEPWVWWKVFKTPPWCTPWGANHNNFSVVNHPKAYQGHCLKPPLLWLTFPYICDGLSVLWYWIGFPIWWQMNFYRQLCY